MSDHRQEATDRPQKPARRHVPPVIVDDFKGVLNFLKIVMPTLSLPCSVTRRKSRYVFQAKSVEDYNRIISALDGRKLPYFTFGLDKARDIRRVIRGLPVDASVGEIDADLRRQGVTPRIVKQLTKPATNGQAGKSPIPLFLVIVDRANDPEGRLDRINSICHLRVQVEASRSSGGPPQCHRCLGFNHSSEHCHRNLRCLRCGESHKKEVCTRSREETPTCANCNGQHIACYGGCPVRKKVIASRRPQQPASNQTSSRGNQSGPAPSRQDWPRLPQRQQRQESSEHQEDAQQERNNQRAQRPTDDPGESRPTHTNTTHRPTPAPRSPRPGRSQNLSNPPAGPANGGRARAPVCEQETVEAREGQTTHQNIHPPTTTTTTHPDNGAAGILKWLQQLLLNHGTEICTIIVEFTSAADSAAKMVAAMKGLALLSTVMSSQNGASN